MQQQQLRHNLAREATASLEKQQTLRHQTIRRDKFAEPSYSKRVDRAIVGGTPLSGRVQSRTTATGLIFKRWQACYWLFEGPATIFFFKSEDHMNQWVETRKEKLVSLWVDFDTMGLLQPVDRAGTKRIRSSSNNSKLMSTRMKYAYTEVHTKVYGKQLLHSFKLERWTDVGVDVIAAFASSQPAELVDLRIVMHYCIQMVTPQKKKAQEVHRYPHGGIDGDTHAMTEATEPFPSRRPRESRRTVSSL